MRYVFIPLPLITDGKPGLVYCPGRVARGSGSSSGVISASTLGTRLAPDTGSLEPIFEAALSPSAPHLIYRFRRVNSRVRPLPAEFLDALDGQDEVLVTSREGATRGTVPMWFIVAPPGVVYLFTFGFSTKARRWQADPWVRLRAPGSSVTAEGVVRFVVPEEIDADLAEQIVERWSMQGAPTVEGLRRTIREGVHALLRVEAGDPQPAPAS
jgi:hypothetical protein